ncbi:SDR family oxidoreductase [Piscinibacter gummiphilus]|uniref:Short-chain dehydrogenase n=1 Tax=Piscinibacter gummiphilus TaxID=946333 RepID=A0A1W6LA32_9BURK|nr:SDR family oxidoreductase [Piscinibacter gummiphilus]ARN21149.1 short-chain dehydrogenase [Piscinibacter gummiphilus]ATU65830.1 short-chain dehydrogenase [Piscinibacter gummiphilus]GLS93704.1 short-chain dehydrogenase [Piscinibacter gummiphilus]
MKARNLAGQCVVLTGATSGIGRATAVQFARAGVDLVLAARRQNVLDEVAAQCQALGAQVLVVPTDVTDERAVRALASAAVARFGGIDVWVNNVGVGAVGSFVQTPLKSHHRVIEANLLGHINGAHAVLPHFIARKSGVLINMISVGAWAAAPYASAYSASKFGLRGFSEALRGELHEWRDIHVCDVYPAFMDTPGVSHAANYTGRKLRPAPPLYDPRLAAAAVVSLAREPRSSVSVGGAATAMRLAHWVSPALSAWLGAQAVERGLSSADSAPRSDGNLFAPSVGAGIDGGYRHKVARTAVPTTAVAVAAGLVIGLLAHRLARRT